MLTLDNIRQAIEDDTIIFTGDCVADNYGTDGGIRYQQDAIIDGQKGTVYWDTTQEYNDFTDAYNRKMRLVDDQVHRDLTEEEEQFLADYDDTIEDMYLNDESNNCDWSNPVDFSERD